MSNWYANGGMFQLGRGDALGSDADVVDPPWVRGCDELEPEVTLAEFQNPVENSVVVSWPDKAEQTRLRGVIGEGLARKIDWMGRGKKLAYVVGAGHIPAIVGTGVYLGTENLVQTGLWVAVSAAVSCCNFLKATHWIYNSWTNPRIERMQQAHLEISDEIRCYAGSKDLVGF